MPQQNLLSKLIRTLNQLIKYLLFLNFRKNQEGGLRIINLIDGNAVYSLWFNLKTKLCIMENLLKCLTTDDDNIFSQSRQIIFQNNLLSKSSIYYGRLCDRILRYRFYNIQCQFYTFVRFHVKSQKINKHELKTIINFS